MYNKVLLQKLQFQINTCLKQPGLTQKKDVYIRSWTYIAYLYGGDPLIARGAYDGETGLKGCVRSYPPLLACGIALWCGGVSNELNPLS